MNYIQWILLVGYLAIGSSGVRVKVSPHSFEDEISQTLLSYAN